MKTSAQTTFAERAGRRLGRMWRGFARLDRKACGWLVEQGLPVGAAKALLWIIELAVFGVLLYTASWLVLLLAFAIAAAWTAQNADWDEKREPEWKNGPAGFGLYTYDGYRIDPHVSDED
jgi:hypothetical protein